MLFSSSLLNPLKSILGLHFPIHQKNIFLKSHKTLSRITKMSSWTCSRCTFVNAPSQDDNCEICHAARPQSVPSSSSYALKSKWSCTMCTFLNPYHSTVCEVCGTRASASLLSTLEVDFDDQLGSSVGSVFLPLQSCTTTKKLSTEKPEFGGDTGSDKLKGIMSLFSRGNYGKGGIEDFDSEADKGFSAVLRPCSSKRKYGDGIGADGVGADPGGSDMAVDVQPSGSGVMMDLADENHSCSESKTWKILSYNIWFREDLEMHNRMRALGTLIKLHSPDVICFQEVTPAFYDIFKKTAWWKAYKSSISDETIPGAYFCMQLCRLPVKSYTCKPFRNSIMGRELCIAEVDVQPGLPIVVATSHLESPCPSPPKWDQMFSKERVVQANEATTLLDKNQNVVFCGDMNWDDKLDGPFPLPEGWTDAWTELRPGDVGWTYDTKSNKMLSGNRALQKRLDRFLCKLKDFKITGIEMIGTDPIPGLSYIKEKRVRGSVKELELPVLPSDHYGLLLTMAPSG